MHKYVAHLLRSLIVVLIGAFGLMTLVTSSTPAFAANGVRAHVTYQAKLLDTTGAEVPDGIYQVRFSLYDAAVAGTRLWTASGTTAVPLTVDVSVQDGLFTVLLGDGVTQLPFDGIDWNSDSLYLGVTIGADAEMTPRRPITAVPQAINSSQLSGMSPSSTDVYGGESLFTLFQASSTSATATRSVLDLRTNGASNVNDYIIRGISPSGTALFSVNSQGQIMNRVGENAEDFDVTADIGVYGFVSYRDTQSAVTFVHTTSETGQHTSYIGFHSDATDLANSAVAFISRTTETNEMSIINGTGNITIGTFLGDVNLGGTNLLFNGTPICLQNGNNCASSTGTLQTAYENGRYVTTTNGPIYFTVSTGQTNIAPIASSDAIHSSFVLADSSSTYNGGIMQFEQLDMGTSSTMLNAFAWTTDISNPLGYQDAAYTATTTILGMDPQTGFTYFLGFGGNDGGGTIDVGMFLAPAWNTIVIDAGQVDITGSLTENGTAVCLQDGTNCSSSTGTLQTAYNNGQSIANLNGPVQLIGTVTTTIGSDDYHLLMSGEFASGTNEGFDLSIFTDSSNPYLAGTGTALIYRHDRTLAPGSTTSSGIGFSSDDSSSYLTLFSVRPSGISQNTVFTNNGVFYHPGASATSTFSQFFALESGARVDSSLIPRYDATWSLGSDTNRWNGEFAGVTSSYQHIAAPVGVAPYDGAMLINSAAHGFTSGMDIISINDVTFDGTMFLYRDDRTVPSGDNVRILMGQDDVNGYHAFEVAVEDPTLGTNSLQVSPTSTWAKGDVVLFESSAATATLSVVNGLINIETRDFAPGGSGDPYNTFLKSNVYGQPTDQGLVMMMTSTTNADGVAMLYSNNLSVTSDPYSLFTFGDVLDNGDRNGFQFNVYDGANTFFMDISATSTETNGDIIPDLDGLQSLGLSNYRWNGWFSAIQSASTLNIDATSTISLSSDSLIFLDTNGFGVNRVEIQGNFFLGSGNIDINGSFESDLYPQLDGLYSIGSGATRWDGYFDDIRMNNATAISLTVGSSPTATGTANYAMVISYASSASFGGLCIDDSSNGETCPSNVSGTSIMADGRIIADAFDLAETYETSDALEPGDIVVASTINDLQVVRSSNTTTLPMGIVSTDPGLQLGYGKSGAHPIALAGRVPTKVSTINGEIKAGDLLAPTTIPGVAGKAIEDGPIVGIALQSYNGADIGKVEVFVKTSWYSKPNTAPQVVENNTYITNITSSTPETVRRGLARIEAGATKVHVSYETILGYPYIQVTPKGLIIGAWSTDNYSDTGFDIILEQPQSFDATFNWEARPIEGSTVMSLSDGTTVLIDPVTGQVIVQEPPTPPAPEPVPTTEPTPLPEPMVDPGATSTESGSLAPSSTESGL